MNKIGLIISLFFITIFTACVPPLTMIKDEQNKVWGKFFESDKQGAPILYLTGSSGGIDEHVASIYNELGFPVLSLGYFYPEAEQGKKSDVPSFVPREMDRMPVELIGNGLAWLAEKFPNRKVTVAAGSKGVEGFLAFASTGDERIKIVSKAILLSGGGICFEGALHVNTARTRTSGHSSWTYQGVELPFVKIGDFKPSIHNNNVAFVDMYTQALDSASASGQVDRAIFDLSHLSHVQILIVAGADDKVAPVVREAELLLAKNNSPSNVEFVKIDNAGHMVTFPYLDKQGWFKFGRMNMLVGDTSKEAAEKTKIKISEYLFGR